MASAGGTPGHDCVQSMKGAMSSPVLKWHYAASNPVEWKHSAAADLDGDGSMEVLITSRDTRLYCLDGTTGQLEWFFGTGNIVETSPAVGDVNGDGCAEVVVSTHDPDNAGYRVFVLDDPQNSSDCGEVLGADEPEPRASFRAEAGRLRLSLPRTG